MIKIYTISCPITNQVKYIGKTKQSIEIRLKQHIKSTKQYNHKMSTWLKSVINQNLYPVIEELELCYNDVDANKLESMYIGLFKSWGFELKNMTDGGDGVSNMSLEVRDKISKARIGKFCGDKNPFYGKNHTEETLILLRGPKSIEHIQKNSNAIKKAYLEGRLNSKGANNSRCKKLAQYDIDGNLIKIYDYIKQAEEDGFRRRLIQNCLNGTVKKYKGYIWEYYKED